MNQHEGDPETAAELEKELEEIRKQEEEVAKAAEAEAAAKAAAAEDLPQVDPKDIEEEVKAAEKGNVHLSKQENVSNENVIKLNEEIKTLNEEISSLQKDKSDYLEDLKYKETNLKNLYKVVRDLFNLTEKIKDKQVYQLN